MKIFGLLLSLLLLASCNPFPADSQAQVVQPKPVSPDQPPPKDYSYEISRNFKLIRDDGTKLHSRAMQDSHGNAWSLLVMGPLAHGDLAKTCDGVGGKAPTVLQLERLAQDLGRGTEASFHPEYMNWDLKKKLFWSIDSDQPEKALGLNGDTGAIQEIAIEAERAYALCVMGDGHVYYQCRSENKDFKLLTLRMVLQRESNQISSTFRVDINNLKDEITQYWQDSEAKISVGGGYTEFTSSFKASSEEVGLDIYSDGDKSVLTRTGHDPIALTCELL